MDAFANLPDEVLDAIFFDTNWRTLCLSLPTVCKRFNRIANDRLLWKRLAKPALGPLGLAFHAADLQTGALWKTFLFANYCKHLYDRNDRDLAVRIGMAHAATCPVCPAGSPAGRRTWICASPDCRHIGCGRRESAHALAHFLTNPSHELCMSSDAKTLWCYACDRSLSLRSGPEKDRLVALRRQIREVSATFICERGAGGA